MQEPIKTNNKIKEYIEEIAQDIGLSVKKIPSWAGHDSQEMANIAPVGMIFIPSKNGISHSPEEFSSEKDIYNGTIVMAKTLLEIDQKNI